MAGPNLCSVTNPNVTGSNCRTEYLDVTGDNIVDTVAVCKNVQITWKGNKEACASQLERVIPKDKFIGKNGGTITTNMAVLKEVGVSSLFCEDAEKVKVARERLGISTGRNTNEDCFVKFYGSQNWLLSYPEPKEKGLTVGDIRNYTAKKFIKFRGNTLGIGTWARFKLAGGREVTGIVVEIGAYRPWMKKPEDKISEKDINVFIYSVDTKNPDATKRYGATGVKVNLSDITTMYRLSGDEPEILAEEYKKAHKSVKEILDDLAPEGSSDSSGDVEQL